MSTATVSTHKAAPFTDAQLEQLCAVIADTDYGLTGREIGDLLARKNIADPAPGVTKRIRLFQALITQQRSDGCGNCVLSFIKASMDPVRFVGRSELFEQQREALNA